TQAYNRRYFDKKLKEETKRALRYTRHLAILIIDVDHFKEINDTYGHKQGDVILQELSRLFKKNTREGVDVVCRYGGDEFILLLPETSLERGSLMATKLLRETRTHPFPNLAKPSQSLKVTLSLGVSAMGTAVQSEDDLVRTADEALYESKRGGRNRVSIWSGTVPAAKGT
ncbi:MAG: GGDEF domain-containing protein, partial [Planctomycetota bacterium]